MAASPNKGAQNILQENRTFFLFRGLLLLPKSTYKSIFIGLKIYRTKQKRSEQYKILDVRRPKNSPSPLLSEEGSVCQSPNVSAAQKSLCTWLGKDDNISAPKHKIASLLLHLCHCVLALSQLQHLWILSAVILWALILQNLVNSKKSSYLL